jgi:hypothetical protein
MSPYEIPDVFFRRPAWHAQAACRGMGTAMFFPGRTDDLDDARAVCARCNVKAECLAAALEDPTIALSAAAYCGILVNVVAQLAADLPELGDDVPALLIEVNKRLPGAAF